MPRKTALCSAILIISLILTGTAFADEMTVDQIIAKNIETRGGLEAWDAIETAKVEGIISMAGTMELPVTMYYKNPGMVRMEMEMQGQQIVQAYDGTSGWQIMPLMGKTEPQTMSDTEVKMVKNQADFEGPLINYEKKGHTVELIGKEDVEGTEAYHLKVTLKSGDVIDYFLDTEHFLEFKQQGTMMAPTGQEVKTNISIGDYKEVDGLIFPHSMEITPEGSPQGMSITLSKADFNPKLEDEFFKMPAVEAPTAQN